MDQTILKNTAPFSKGFEGVDLSELSTSETCHLGKAQSFVSREPRPILNQSLDEIYEDTVRKNLTCKRWTSIFYNHHRC